MPAADTTSETERGDYERLQDTFRIQHYVPFQISTQQEFVPRTFTERIDHPAKDLNPDDQRASFVHRPGHTRKERSQSARLVRQVVRPVLVGFACGQSVSMRLRWWCMDEQQLLVHIALAQLEKAL